MPTEQLALVCALVYCVCLRLRDWHHISISLTACGFGLTAHKETPGESKPPG